MKARYLMGCFCILTSSLLFGQPVIEEGEYFFDTDPGQGNGTAISTVPNPNESPVNFSFDIPAGTLAALDDGWHSLGIRFKDDEGDWGVTSIRRILVGEDTLNQPAPNIVAGEYFWNEDPGQGNGKAIIIETPTTTLDINFEIPAEEIAALDPGFHDLGIRFQDSEGDWGVTAIRRINRVEPLSPEQIDAKVERIDYQWFVEGEEVGETMSLTPEEPLPVIAFEEVLDLKDLDGVTAVLRMTPYDTAGNMGHPAFQNIMIEWLDEENGGVGDGLPDAWEDQFDILSSTEVNDPNADSDDDGLSDLDEFLNGTLPDVPDSDGDGINDRSEVLLAAYGFNPSEDNADLLANLQDAAFGAGLYSTEVQLKDININAPVVGRDPATGKIFLQVRIQQSSTLEETDWTQLALGEADVTTSGGDVRVTIPDVEDDVYFLRVFTDEDFQ